MPHLKAMFFSLLERIIQIDTSLFYILNNKATNVVFDFLMPILTNLDYWKIPLAMIVVLLAIFGKRKGRVAVVLLVLGVALSDQICNTVVKPLVGRIRPCNVLENVRLLVNGTKSLSFPSSHATNIFTGTLILSSIYRRLKIPLIIIATLVAYSRIYVGVHYPLDVLIGSLLGILSALITISIYRVFSRRFPKIGYVEDKIMLVS
jgi:undecaprenyl-diphosphatase